MDSLDFSQIHNAGGYSSDFESDAETRNRKRDLQNLIPQKKRGTGGVENKRKLEDEYSKEEGKIQRHHILSMDVYARHKMFVNNYLLYYGGTKAQLLRDGSKDKTDFDIIRENHQFLWEEEDGDADTWGKKLAKKYYDKLFKEYCIADLSRYKENKIGMRWRNEQEVINGKGQFICGNKKCSEKEDLRSWEVNFGYVEHGEKKNALVKLRLCPDCSYKLNYHHKKKEVIAAKKKSKETSKKQKSDLQANTETDPASSSDRVAEIDSAKAAAQIPDRDGTDSSVWSGPAKIVDEKSKEEEFDDYFEDMFL